MKLLNDRTSRDRVKSEGIVGDFDSRRLESAVQIHVQRRQQSLPRSFKKVSILLVGLSKHSGSTSL